MGLALDCGLGPGAEVPVTLWLPSVCSPPGEPPDPRFAQVQVPNESGPPKVSVPTPPHTSLTLPTSKTCRCLHGAALFRARDGYVRMYT